ncbi:MAG: phosphate butyryltransferase, partial [Firmicutes bacterium]|nr:phosphate butyryltransferase [Bacillota bacterium]
MIKDVNQLLEMAASADKRKIAVAAAHDSDVIDAVVRASRQGIADAVLVGRGKDIEALLEKEGMKGAFEIVDSESDVDSAAKAVALAKEGRVNCLMKGLLST